MLLKSIKLKDFRQFKGEQDPILFSTDAQKNVTVIMGENGSGKTTLAQAFTWCLYGDTDFEDKLVLCKATASLMMPNSEELVRVELSLIHNGIEYTIIREQLYTKDRTGKLKIPNNTVLHIAFKNKDGQHDFVADNQTEWKMKDILPKELSKYFFFDGERIGNMSKEIRRGKSQEFAQAVRGLLGLNALISTLEHLNAKGTKSSVMRSYNLSYDERSDAKLAQYNKEIAEYERQIEKIDIRLDEIEKEEVLSQEKCTEWNVRIKDNAESEPLTRAKEKLRQKLNGLIQQKTSSTKSLLEMFNKRAPAYFAKKLMKDSLQALSEADQLDKGIPDIHKRTIDFLMNRNTCLCGTHIESETESYAGNSAYKTLKELLYFIPPQSIGTLIGQFSHECEVKSARIDGFFEDISRKYAVVRDFEGNYSDTEEEIKRIESRLKNMENIGRIQKDLMRYEYRLKELKEERDNLNIRKGGLKKEKKRRFTQRHELSLTDENNKRIEVYKAYTQYMYDSLNGLYQEKEAQTRADLGKAINDIFRNIYNGGFSLEIDEKYNIQIIVNDYEGYKDDVETSTAQSISVIFAFIAGVIKMARDKNSENEILVSEPYPLVMDAPLSAFDKTRIKTVCEALPNVAEQVIIFIKDTDGELAETYMSDKVGRKYMFGKKNEFETYLIKR